MADRPHPEEETPDQAEDRETYEVWAAERARAERWKALAKRLRQQLIDLRGRLEDGARRG